MISNDLKRLQRLAEAQNNLTRLLYEGKKIVEELPAKPEMSILLLHDLHIGYCDFEVIEKLLNSVQPHRFDIGVVSEVMDLTSFSPFQRERGGDIKQELVLGREIYELLLKTIVKEIHILPSNHEKRAEKRVRDYLSQLPPDAVDLVAQAVNEYLTWRDQKPKGLIWHRGMYLRVGSVWITHGDRFLLTPGAAGRDILKALGSLGGSIGFSYDQTELVVYAHEHRYNAGVAEGARIVLWSMPACCYVPFYTLDEPPSRYSRYPQSLGWGIITLDKNKRVDWQKTKLEFAGWTRIPETK